MYLETVIAIKRWDLSEKEDIIQGLKLKCKWAIVVFHIDWNRSNRWVKLILPTTLALISKNKISWFLPGLLCSLVQRVTKARKPFVFMHQGHFALVCRVAWLLCGSTDECLSCLLNAAVKTEGTMLLSETKLLERSKLHMICDTRRVFRMPQCHQQNWGNWQRKWISKEIVFHLERVRVTHTHTYGIRCLLVSGVKYIFGNCHRH